jgi:hypothetical protein
MRDIIIIASIGVVAYIIYKEKEDKGFSPASPLGEIEKVLIEQGPRLEVPKEQEIKKIVNAANEEERIRTIAEIRKQREKADFKFITEEIRKSYGYPEMTQEQKNRKLKSISKNRLIYI